MNSHARKEQWGFGRLEYLACLDDIRKKAGQHVTIRSVYDELFTSGKITVCYPHFCKFATGRAGLPGVYPPRKCKVGRKSVDSETDPQPEVLPVSLPETPVLPAPMDSTSTFKPGTFDYDPEKAAQKKDF